MVLKSVLILVSTKPKCVLPLSCVPKKNGKSRLVLDCRHINSCIQCPSFQQEGIPAVEALIQANDELFTVDLKDGFYHIEVHPSFRTYLGIKWKNQYYVWSVLAFGISIAPYYFNKVVRVMVVYLCENNIRIAPFIDDFLGMVRPKLFTDHQDFVLHTMQELGWQVNYEKSMLNRSTVANFVGFNISTHDDHGPWVKALPAKIRKLRRSIANILNKQKVSARCLARVMGQCISMTKAIVPGKLLLHNVYRVLAQRHSWDDKVLITEQAATDLRWWLSAIHSWNEAPLCNKKTIDIQIQTDASLLRWGGTDLIRDTAGLWSKSVQFQHSNYRELLAVYMTLQSLCANLRNKVVQVLSDNVTTVAYINRLGGASQQMSDLMTTIWSFALNHNIQLTARHLSGVLNG